MFQCISSTLKIDFLHIISMKLFMSLTIVNGTQEFMGEC